jgi:hypothetical protein
MQLGGCEILLTDEFSTWLYQSDWFLAELILLSGGHCICVFSLFFEFMIKQLPDLNMKSLDMLFAAWNFLGM